MNNNDSGNPASGKARISGGRTSVMFVLICGIAACLWLAYREPRYHEKPASFWFDHMGSVRQTEEAVAAFKGMGKPGVLYLVETIEVNPRRPRYHESWADKLAKWRISQFLPQSFLEKLSNRGPPIDRRERALSILRMLGPAAEPALPRLMRQFNAVVCAHTMWEYEYSDLVSVLEAMGDLKAQYIPDFIKAVQSDWERTIVAGVDLLGSIGPKAKDAVPVMLERMQGSDWWLSNSVAEAVWKIDRRTNVALEVFTNNLALARNGSKAEVLGLLRAMGPAAQPATGMVLRILTNSDINDRWPAAKTLSQINPALFKSTMAELNKDVPTKVQRLVERVDRTNDFGRMRLFEALAMYGVDAKSAVPTLIEILKTSPPSGIFPGGAWQEAIAVLAEIGPDAHPAVPVLIALLPAKRVDCSPLEICRALRNIGPGAAEAIPELKRLLQGNNEAFRFAATLALASVAPQEKTNLAPVLRRLEKEAKNKDDLRLAFKAEVALWRLGLEPAPPLSEMTSPGQPWPPDTVQMLGDIGPAAKSALPYVEQILSAERWDDIESSRMAAIAIRKIDPQEADKLGLPGILALP